jgi:hypothetical protein
VPRLVVEVERFFHRPFVFCCQVIGPSLFLRLFVKMLFPPDRSIEAFRPDPERHAGWVSKRAAALIADFSQACACEHDFLRGSCEFNDLSRA